MCFSAPASFAVSAVLLPVGAYCLHKAWRANRRYLALASFPLLFGMQQAVEGMLWLALGSANSANVTGPALGFLLFAYFLWPFYVPLAAARVETNPRRHRFFLAFSVIGLLFGASLYVPLFLMPDWLSVRIVKLSILYDPILIYDGVLPRTGVRLLYATIVAIPVLFSTVSELKRFGVLILASVIISAVLFAYAFVSVWCFFAAVLSLYILLVVRQSNQIGEDAGHPPGDVSLSLK